MNLSCSGQDSLWAAALLLLMADGLQVWREHVAAARGERIPTQRPQYKPPEGPSRYHHQSRGPRNRDSAATHLMAATCLDQAHENRPVNPLELLLRLLPWISVTPDAQRRARLLPQGYQRAAKAAVAAAGPPRAAPSWKACPVPKREVAIVCLSSEPGDARQAAS